MMVKLGTCVMLVLATADLVVNWIAPEPVPLVQTQGDHR
jgi:hypothetical protein